MILSLYKNNSDSRKLNKDLTLIKDNVNFVFLENTSIMTPSLKLQLSPADIVNCNYLYIETLQKYYFITDTTILTNNIIQLNCKTDVLMTYKNDILDSQQIITRATDAKAYNRYLKDSELGSTVQKQIQQKIVDTDIFDVTSLSQNYVLTTISPKIETGGDS